MLPIHRVVGNGISSSSSDLLTPLDSAYCCLKCHQEIRRLHYNVLGRVLRPLPVCSCVKIEFEEHEIERQLAERRNRLLNLYGEGLIDYELQRATFRNFEVSQDLETAYRYASHFTKNFVTQKTSLYFYGPVGVGKSHLAAAIHNELQAQGYACLFIDVTRLFGLMKSTFRDGSRKSDQDYIRSAIQCELLTLDEIGLTPLTEY